MKIEELRKINIWKATNEDSEAYMAKLHWQALLDVAEAAKDIEYDDSHPDEHKRLAHALIKLESIT